MKTAERAAADLRDAACLRDAALILSRRARKMTFGLRVVIKFLRHTADRIEKREIQ